MGGALGGLQGASRTPPGSLWGAALLPRCSPSEGKDMGLMGQVISFLLSAFLSPPAPHPKDLLCGLDFNEVTKKGGGGKETVT